MDLLAQALSPCFTRQPDKTPGTVTETSSPSQKSTATDSSRPASYMPPVTFPARRSAQLERTSHMNTPFCYIQCTRRHTPCNQQPATSGRGVRREAGTGDGRIGDGATSIRSLSFVGQSCYRYRYRVTGVWRLRCTWLWTRIECRPGELTLRYLGGK